MIDILLLNLYQKLSRFDVIIISNTDSLWRDSKELKMH